LIQFYGALFGEDSMDTSVSRKPGFSGGISLHQAKDTGMAITLSCLVFGLYAGNNCALYAAVISLLLNMIWPAAYKPAGRIWFGVSHVLGNMMSKILLSLIFFLIVTPVGLIRRLLGHDTLQLKKWKKGQESVFKTRDFIARSKDLEVPY
jgi:hypothetical protein